uniref:Uncharacterized protein n=1 Tax=Rhizophora mucronata TaxID=61149 RepID=A0A2P2KB01_RHIMU
MNKKRGTSQSPRNLAITCAYSYKFLVKI